MFKALKNEMRTQHTNQKRLAKHIGICEKSMSLKMTGNREFTRAEMLAICSRFSKSLDCLFGENS